MKNQIKKDALDASKINQKGSASNASKEEKKSPKNASNASKEIQKNIESKLRDIPRNSFINSPSIYKIPKEKWDAMGDRDRKKFRRNMRSQLKRFSNAILGKDRSDIERRESIKEFKSFFKENYIADKLDASAIYSGSNEIQRKEYADMIFIIENFK